MTLDDVREKIDYFDNETIHFLIKRIENSLLSKKLKKVVEDKQRENQIFKRIKSNYSDLLSEDFLESIYKLIIEHSKLLQKQGKKLIAFQGEHGAYSEVAAKKWDKNFMPISCSSFNEVFEKVKNSLCDFGIVPVENTLGGIIGEVNEKLLYEKIFIVGAVDHPIHHCLVAVKDVNYREIKQVYSHPQALSQCINFIKRQNFKPIEYYDTAGAAKFISDKQDKTSAAISSKLAAKYYDLEIVKYQIEDLTKNITRFLVISNESSDDNMANKCSIVFSSPNSNKAGSLYSILKIFADNQINLTRLESFPRYDKIGHYAFFVDFIGSQRDKTVKYILKKIETTTNNYKFLGCYKEISED